MKVNIGFAQYVAVIEFEPFLGEDIEKYQKEFEKWYFIKKGRLIIQNPKLNYDCFDAQVIIDWLKIASPKCRARIVEPFLNVGEEDTTLPYMYF